ncbi:7-cyano-7-deazaguanine synthase [Candidatus Pacearchaeota archaeon]|nr:7-cyano-7-deazaguanine synthase [Candidatus Pacearchaeota archaeon]
MKGAILIGSGCCHRCKVLKSTITFCKGIKLYCKPFKIIAPLIKKDKEDIILLGQRLGVNFRNTFSCYAPKRKNALEHCGCCLACRLRQAGFYWAGVKDETEYKVK